MPLVTEIVSQRAADTGWQVLEDVIFWLFLGSRSVQEQDNQGPKDRDRHPIVDRLQDTSP
ncbi:hypothetical protein D3C84_1269120 [compost metagenome]